MRKDELLRYLRKKEAPEAELSDKRVPELRELCRQKYPAPTVADILAKNYEYDVLWLPPYHPAFNPIENAWGIEKGYVAWTNDGSSFEDVKDIILTKLLLKFGKNWFTGAIGMRTHTSSPENHSLK